MTPADIVTVVAGVGAPLALIGGGVKFVVSRIDKLDERVCEAEKETAKVRSDYARLLVTVQRWRTAFQIVASELKRHDPQSHALALASSMLVEVPIDLPTPKDMEAMLNKLEQPELDLWPMTPLS